MSELFQHEQYLVRGALDALRIKNPLRLRELSEQSIHSTTVYQDEVLISLAVLLYSLFKIFEKEPRNIQALHAFSKDIEKQLSAALNALQKNKHKSFQRRLKKIHDTIKSYEHNFGLYVREVLEQARIQKGSRIVEHGLSAGRAAELLGISQWELQNYLGYTKIPDTAPSTSVKKRLEYVRKLFT